MEEAFMKHTSWSNELSRPYITRAPETMTRLFRGVFKRGVTITAPGFYGPQGRVLRLPLHDPDLNGKIGSFRHGDERITNYEMECSALYSMAGLLGHEAMTVCTIIANRVTKKFDPDNHASIRVMIEKTMQIIAGMG
jgi:uridine phosphorylase